MVEPSTSADFRLSSYEPLNGLVKQKCGGCGRMRMYFCYDCRRMMPGVVTPTVKLPALVDVVKHPKEKNSKSTAAYCALVAPEQTRIFDAPHFDDYGDGSHPDGATVCLFFLLEQFRFWYFRVGGMRRLPQLAKLPCVALDSYKTAFWRPQHNQPDTNLATIEAIYYALREYQEIRDQRKYEGEFDDLLYWFYFMRDKVDEREGAYKRRKDEELRNEEESPLSKQTHNS